MKDGYDRIKIKTKGGRIHGRGGIREGKAKQRRMLYLETTEKSSFIYNSSSSTIHNTHSVLTHGYRIVPCAYMCMCMWKVFKTKEWGDEQGVRKRCEHLNALHSTTLHYTTLHYATPHCNASHCAAKYGMVWYCSDPDCRGVLFFYNTAQCVMLLCLGKIDFINCLLNHLSDFPTD